MRKNRIIIKLICFISIVITFFISNISNANDLRWDLHFENIEITEGSVTANQEATIVGTSRSQVVFDVTLNVPGDFYEFTVNAVNNGTVDAMINEIGINRLTEDQKKYMTYDITYSDGVKVKVNDKLKAGTTEVFRIRVAFKDDISPDDLTIVATNAMLLTLNTSYVQADENAVDRDRNTISNYNTVNTANMTNVIDNEDTNPNIIVSITNDESSNNSQANKNKTVTKIIEKVNSIRTGDGIILYIVILILAVIALVLTFKKKDKTKDEE